MIRKLLVKTILLFGLVNAALAADNGRPLYLDSYPAVEQALISTDVFPGDRYKDYKGDFIAHLNDGSAWKIHPEDSDLYREWLSGDILCIRVRTEWYWLKREHKFSLYNQTRDQAVRVMLIQHKSNPELRVISTESYSKSKQLKGETVIIPDPKSGKLKASMVYKNRPSDLRKVIGLSDGTFWVIKDKLDFFTLGTKVYVGAQGSSSNYYDFVFIVGDQREAQWTYARPQK